MKPTLFAIATFAFGSAIGWIITRTEFVGETLPVTSLTATSAYPGEQAKIGPKAVVANGSSFDFGTIERHASDSHEFEIRNDGDSPLTLQIGTTTCKCTSFAFEKGQLAPGESTMVKLEWTVKTLEMMFEQSAELITNDPKNNPLVVSIRGRVVDLVKPDRLQLTLGDVSANEPHTVKMRLHAYRDHQLEIVKHEWLRPQGVDHFEISVTPLTAEQVAQERGAFSGVEVTLLIRPGLPLGSLAQTLRLSTNAPEHAPVDMPVVGTIVSDVSLAGGGVTADRLLVNMGPLALGVEHKKTVYLIVKGPFREQTGLTIDSIDPQQDFSATLGEPLRDNPKLVRYPLTIVIPATAQPVARTADETFARIKLGITHPQVKEMTVHVRYTIK